MCRPTDDGTQETFCARCKRTHTLKTSVICAVKRKWTCELLIFTGRASDLEAWADAPFANSITIESVILGLADKGVNKKRS